MREYSCLKKQVLVNGKYSIVPIREEDRYVIMEMRNAQLYHLRQQELLSKKKQDQYFSEVISKIFDAKQPSQVLFSFLVNSECVGYGGLVHINWLDKHAEISFIIKSELEQDYFGASWKAFLSMIQQVAFEDIELHKIFTNAFDLRPNLYPILESSDFYKEAVLKDHCFSDGKFVDVIIHSKINQYE